MIFPLNVNIPVICIFIAGMASLAVTTSVSAFTPPLQRAARQPSLLAAAKKPTFDKKTARWDAGPDAEEDSWDAFGSFLRQGPNPFLVRVFSPDDYDQAVLKYMASEKCARAEAQGNMDAFFNNAADWAYQKSEEKRGSPKVDYTILNPKQAVLILSWAFFVTPFLFRCAYLIAFTGVGWGVTLDNILDFSS